MQDNKKEAKVVRISRSEASDMLKQYHYLGRAGSGKSYAVMEGTDIAAIAVLSNSRNISGYAVCELSRFMVVDNRPNNASRLLAVLIRHVKDDYSAIISYSDEVVGHKGTIYTALGAIDLGKGKDTVGFKMADGRIISGRNASYALLGKEEEAKVIRIPGKHKFLLVTDAKNKEKLGNLFK